MEITTREGVDGSATVLCIAGAMTIYEAAQARDRLLAALPGGTAVVVDLSGVAEIDTAGIQLLVMLAREARRRGCALRFAPRSEAVNDAFERLDLSRYMER